MTEYSGSLLQVFYNTVDISATARSCKITESADEPEQIDTTHRGDTARTTIESFPGKATASVELNILDETLGTANLLDFAINAKDTLIIYPRGKTQTYAMVTVNNARLISLDQNIPYDDAVDLTATFFANNTVTRGTYTT